MGFFFIFILFFSIENLFTCFFDADAQKFKVKFDECKEEVRKTFKESGKFIPF